MRNKNSCCFVNCGQPSVVQIERITSQLKLEIQKLINREVYNYVIDDFSVLDKLAEPILKKFILSNPKISILYENKETFLMKRAIIDKCDYCICSICDEKHESEELEYAFLNNLRIVPLFI